MALPKFEITTKHVISFFWKEYRMKVSEADARRWLDFWKHTFASDLKKIVTPCLGDIFRNATYRNYPNKAFTRLQNKVQDAIDSATCQYEDKIGMEWRSTTLGDREYCSTVLYLIKPGRERSEAVIWQGMLFMPPGSPHAEVEEHAPYRVHIVVQGKKVKARIMETDEPIPARVKVFGVKKTTRERNLLAGLPSLKSTAVH